MHGSGSYHQSSSDDSSSASFSHWMNLCSCKEAEVGQLLGENHAFPLFLLADKQFWPQSPRVLSGGLGTQRAEDSIPVDSSVAAGLRQLCLFG